MTTALAPAAPQTEYAFELPDSIPSGLTTFRLKDVGNEQHHVFLVSLPADRSPADLVAAIKAGGPPPAWGRAVDAHDRWAEHAGAGW